MRDLAIALIIFGGIPFTLAQPYVGVLLWSWISYMNPHRLAYGFAYDFPFAAVIAVATLAGLLFSKESKRIPWNSLTIVWLLLVIWMSVTTFFALYPAQAVAQWDETMKIMLISFVTLMVMGSRQRLQMLIWVIVLSLGFYAVKGGIFTILSGGSYLVWGPDQSFIGDNNALGLALVMTLPLMRYLQQTTTSRLLRHALAILMLLTVVAMIGTRSRGAFLAAIAMAFMMWRQSARKVLLGFVIVLVAAGVFAYAPSSWTERMETIQTYEQDPSALGRINAWWFAVNLALDRPLVGGGFDTFEPELFQIYAPEPENFHDSHSIYFQVLGQHGFVGFVLFLWFGFLSLKTTTWVLRSVKDTPDLKWARDLAAAAQACLVSFAVGGAFLGLAYFDLYYHIVVIALLTRVIVEEHLRGSEGLELQRQADDSIATT